ncbi:hypothetical protein [Vibrio sp. M260118]|uniref:hypothetical protein n=1 Tax=Vibrio sp. M260118 TaxID=3020896 RepID=UPI002F41B97F
MSLSALFAESAIAARYCTEKNWQTATDYYKKQEARFNRNINELNEVTELYNDYVFLQDQYPSDVLVGIWRSDNIEAKRALATQKDLFIEEISKLDQTKQTLLKTFSKLKTAKELWEKLADYCYDEDKYQDYKTGRDNMRKVISVQKRSDELLSKIERMRLKYASEIELINDSKRKASAVK